MIEEKNEEDLHIIRDYSAQSNALGAGFCCKPIDEIQKRIDENLLTLAELYRNVGDFEKCLTTLEIITQHQNYDAFIKCIRAEALQKNVKTVKVIVKN